LLECRKVNTKFTFEEKNNLESEKLDEGADDKPGIFLMWPVFPPEMKSFYVVRYSCDVTDAILISTV
jgi:hypothetical protein